MDHQKAAESFSAYLDGELKEPEKAALESHLALCIQCRTELNDLRRTLGQLGHLRQEAPRDLLSNVQKQIYVRSRGRFFSRRWRLFGKIPFEWISLGTIIVMLLYYVILKHTTPGGVKPLP